MHWKRILLKKCIERDFLLFTIKNALEMIFAIKINYCRNDFYYKNALEMNFAIKMHWK